MRKPLININFNMQQGREHMGMEMSIPTALSLIEKIVHEIKLAPSDGDGIILVHIKASIEQIERIEH